MSSDIQFGDLEQAQPQRALRPDQDAHFATSRVGTLPEDELLIFVDLDVMRDMEAHALSNTNVELGGVMLGRQSVDDQGRPFVTISDSLRAEHYEATKGSFKFTHETWSQISRQREKFRPDLEMVGWYHTHPGWNVFLSGMDLFICNNFFNRPLDVALVIDPCKQDRGWFQWNQQNTTQRTSGFVLTTGRFRQQELNQFARFYNKEPMMNIDPRYSGNSFNNAQAPVTYMDNRKPIYEIAIIAMLLMQFLLVCVLAWKLLDASGAATAQSDQKAMVALQDKLASADAAEAQTAREKAYDEVLSTLVASQTGDANLVEEFSKARIESKRLAASLDGQMALAEKLQMEKQLAQNELQLKINDFDELESQMIQSHSELESAHQTIKSLKAQADGTGQTSEEVGGIPKSQWIWLGLGGLVMTLLGSALGYAMGRREDAHLAANDSQQVAEQVDYGPMDEIAPPHHGQQLAASRRAREPEDSLKLSAKEVSLKIDGEGEA